MKKIWMCRGKENYEVLVDQYKIICGSNYSASFEMKRFLQQLYLGIKPSERAEGNKSIPKVSLDDKPLSNKDFLYCRINKEYSLTTDFKLTSKSLALKYFEVLLSKYDFFDTINTLNILFESLTTEMLDHSLLSGRFQTLTSKSLLKMISPFYLLDEDIVNEFNLSIDEIILLQLNMVKLISEEDKSLSQLILLIELDELKEEYLKLIKSFFNTISLIFVPNASTVDRNLKNYYLCENICLDLADDNQFYQTICDNRYKLLTMKEGYEYMEKYLFNEEHEYARFIEKLLK